MNNDDQGRQALEQAAGAGAIRVSTVRVLAPWPTMSNALVLASVPVEVTPAYTVAATMAGDTSTLLRATIRGTSMNLAGIQNGDTVYAGWKPDPRHGDTVVIKHPSRDHGGIPLIKRLIITAAGERWATSVSDDPQHHAFRLQLKDQIIAVVHAVVPATGKAAR